MPHLLRFAGFFSLALNLLLALQGLAAEDSAKPKKNRASTGTAAGENRATPVERLKIAKGFRVELLYSVPKAEQGSWINLCADPRGRIYVSDQYGGLYRFAPPAPGQVLEPAAIERVPARIRAVDGMLWAFGALYVVVDDYGNQMPSGLYRLTDSDGDDRLDRVELLRAIEARGDHGIHAVLPTADGKAIYLVTGNETTPVQLSSSRVPLCWGEDQLLPRIPDVRGATRHKLAPAGTIYRVSPDGKEFEIVSCGLRNPFDAAVNRDGELFTFDADEEADYNTSWYRPTRVCHVVSGSDFGWRYGAGKRPEWYPDNLPPVVNVGPGSPTGITFGYGAKFPARYQEALFVLDWSWGKLYSVHLEPAGASYTAIREEFISGAPLPLTDAIVHPADGAMYFVIGGRKVQSGLYRVTYVGKESTSPQQARSAASQSHELRHQLEAFHGRHDPQAISTAWPSLSNSDRFIRWAARTAIEHQPLAGWSEQALHETDPRTQVVALLALARAGGIDPEHRRPTDPPIDTALQARLLAALEKIEWNDLDEEQRRTWLRALEITLHRFGRPNEAEGARLIAKLDPRFPANSRELNWLLCETLVYLQSPAVAAKGIALLQAAATQEEQIEYARSLRMLKAGWTTETHTAYFRWLVKAASSFRGGASFDKFIEFIRNDAIAGLTEGERSTLREVLAEKPKRISPLDGLTAIFAGRPHREWSLDELASAAQSNLRHRNYENGRKMFGATACFACHRFGNEGGMTGPDLTSAGRRYSPRDLLDQILNPSKEINEQYVPMLIVTKDEEVFQGIVVNLKGDTVDINTNPLDPNQRTSIDRKEIFSIEPSKVSPMPTGLLAVLSQEEILDLLAYLISGGDPSHEMFRR